MPSWFVRPEAVTLAISGGKTITVRRRLSNGEMRARIVRSTIMNGDGVPHTNGLQFALCRVSAFLLDWTVPDESGAIVPIRDLPAADLEAVLDNLEPDAFADIHNAIEAHEAAMANERAEQKKTAGATPSAPISPSPAAVAGDTNG